MEAVKPIAVIGMACRLPGGISNPEDLWEACCQRRSGWSEIPKSRFNHESFYHPNQDRPGSYNPEGAHFLQDDISLFDAPFFRITAREAKAMDPQQRIWLECAYEALENSGVSLHSITGSNTGVFVGNSLSDYAVNLLRDPETLPMFQVTGTNEALISNRLSYLFNLKGPSMTVDTACSSSLTAIHLACQSLKSGESSLAIVGGCHLNVTPDTFINMSMSRLLSPQGKCFAFDERASGFGKGEGAGCVVLKSLENALLAGDSIRAVIRNTGVNQDGSTSGITMPNRDSQEVLIRSVYTAAGLVTSNTTYVESHGTGTSAGDSIESSALGAVFGHHKAPQTGNPVYIGSLKSNVGHLEGVSGVVSLIKTALMLERGFILPNCDFRNQSAKTPFHERNMKVPTKLIQWPKGGTRQASINNFGFGGTNAHAVLEQGPSVPRSQANGFVRVNVPDHSSRFKTSCGVPTLAPRSRRLIVVLSATEKASLELQAANLVAYLRQRPEFFYRDWLGSLALTLQRRSLFSWKLAVPCSTQQELMKALENTRVSPQRSTTAPRIAYVFTGQGAQWHAMGRELVETYPVFSSSIRAAEDCLNTLGAEWSLSKELSKDAGASLVGQPHISQPACTAIQIALIDLFASWGIQPIAVAGHSSGEIAAAYAARALPIDICMSIAYHRGMSVIDLSRNFSHLNGSMMALGVHEAGAKTLIEETQGKGCAEIACVNSPKSVTISGDKTKLVELKKLADEQNIFNRTLHTGVAYHSHHMQLVANDYKYSLGTINPKTQSSNIRFYSSLKGRLVEHSDLDTSYWVDNLTSPVLFSNAMYSLCSLNLAEETQIDTLIELGPHSALKGPIREILLELPEQVPRPGYLSALVRNENATTSTLQMASTLLMAGLSLDIAAINFSGDSSTPALITDLPSYSWTHNDKYWAESRIGRAYRLRPGRRNELIGTPSAEFGDDEQRWRTIVNSDSMPWVQDHKVQSQILYPVAGYLIVAMEAASKKAISASKQFDRFCLREVVVGRALVLPESIDVEMSISLRPHHEGTRTASASWDEFSISSWTDDRGWNEHCRGFVAAQSDQKLRPPLDMDVSTGGYEHTVADIAAACTEDMDAEKVYEDLRQAGFGYGPLFRGLKNIRTDKGKHSFGEVYTADTASSMPHGYESEMMMHPATLDACIHTIWPIFIQMNTQHLPTYVPTYIKNVSMSPKIKKESGGMNRVYASLQSGRRASKTVTLNAYVVDPDLAESSITFEVEGFVMTRISDEVSDMGERAMAYKIGWNPLLSLLAPEQYQTLLGPDEMTEKQKQHIRLQEQASYYYIEKALALVPEKHYKAMPQHHKHLYTWMRRQSRLAKQGQSLLQHRTWSSQDALFREKVLAQAALPDAEGAFLARLGVQLPGILLGEVDPLSEMVRDDLLGKYYQSKDASVSGCNDPLVHAVKLLAHENPHLTIFEVGGGTGAIAAPLIETLNSSGKTVPFKNYCFTDISSGFLEKARIRFASLGRLMTFRQFDADHNPSDQGFVDETYDVVVAHHVLHATKRMEATMRNVRKLLRPGGHLLLVESTVKTKRLFPFGALPGWWLGEEPNRQDSPLLSEAEWAKLLEETNFSGFDGVVRNFPEPYHTTSLMVSTAKISDKISHPSPLVIVCSRPSSQISLPTLRESLFELTGSMAEVISLADVPNIGIEENIFVVLEEVEHPFLTDVSPEQLEAFKRLCNARGILWVTKGAYSENPMANMVLGLARSLRNERTSLNFVTLDLDGRDDLSPDENARMTKKVFRKSFDNPSDGGTDKEFAVREGYLCVPRIVENTKVNQDAFHGPSKVTQQPFAQDNRALKMQLRTIGALDSFYFADHKNTVANGEVKIRVKAAGLNFRDIMVTLGQLNIDSNDIGLECSGIVAEVGSDVTSFAVGDRVCAVADGSFATFTCCAISKAAKIPDNMPFNVAASIPIVYTTAYYCLYDIAHLQRDQTILIHAAAGGVGQAAIMLSQLIGAKIYATVGSAAKKDFLVRMYGLDPDCIFFSRNTSFGRNIREATKTGIDVVLNSLSGDALRVGWECLAVGGIFIEIGKADIQSNSRLEMAQFAKNATFTAVDLVLVFETKPRLCERLLSDVLSLFRDGSIRAVDPVATYSIQDVEMAFRSLQSGKSMGKIVVEPQPNDQVLAVLPQAKMAVLRADASYMIAGGSGGLGRSIARWLVQHGARHLVIASRSGPYSEGVQSLVVELKALDASLRAYSCDIANQDELKMVVNTDAASMPPICGVIQAAMVLRDGILETQPHDDYMAIVRPRIRGTMNLHEVLSKTHLDFFIMLSSMTGIMGAPGQAVYAGTSTFMGAFAHWRVGQGLPADAIHLGAVGGVGYLVDKPELMEPLRKATGDNLLNEQDVLALINASIQGQLASSGGPECLTGLELKPGKTDGVYWAPDAKFSHCRRAIYSDGHDQSASKTSDALSPSSKLRQATSLSAAIQSVYESLGEKFSSILMIPMEDITPTKPVVAYGLDSLVAIEIRNWLDRELDGKVPLMELLSASSLTALAKSVVERSGILDPSILVDDQAKPSNGDV